jgi:acetolactate synthase-1/2/3 large subunit
MVDIDESEINKFKRLGREIEGINEDLTDFLWRNLPKKDYEWELYPSDKDNSGWIAKLTEWKKKYPSGMEAGGQNPYTFIEQLGDKLRSDDVLVSDTGCSLGWMCQVFKFKGQRLLHAWNNTPMGYGLPASIGASFATGKRIILITGDGGLGVNITEFATVARHQLNIKTILFNNYGHQMCRQTQRTWMGGEYPSTSYEGGLATPDFESIAHAYTIPVYKRVEDMLFQYGPGFYEFKIYRENEYQLSPQVQFGRALDDPHPLLPRKELEEIRNV